MLLKFCCGSLGYNCFAVFSMPRREFHTLPNNKTPVGCLFGKMNHVTYRVMMPFPFLSLNSTTPGVSTLAQIMCTQRETLRASCFSDVLLGLMHTKSVAGKHQGEKLPWSTLDGPGRSLQMMLDLFAPSPFSQRCFRSTYGIVQTPDG